MHLSADDYIAIQQLYARYTVAFDLRDRDNPDLDAVLACWTEDGELNLPTQKVEEVGDSFGNPKGHAALRTATEHHMEFAKSENAIYHWNGSIVIEPSEDGASGKCYVMVVSATDPPYDRDASCQVRFAFHYADELVKQDGRWLFRKRTLRAQ